MPADQGQAPAGFICDKGCKKRFELPHKPEQLQIRAAGTYKGQDVTVNYFICPYCGAEYVTHCETAETKRMTAKYQKLQEKRRVLLGTMGNPGKHQLAPKQVQKAIKEAEQLIKREKKLMRQMQELKGKIKEYLNV